MLLERDAAQSLRKKAQCRHQIQRVERPAGGWGVPRLLCIQYAWGGSGNSDVIIDSLPDPATRSIDKFRLSP
jgi:hypothetical protein